MTAKQHNKSVLRQNGKKSNRKDIAHFSV